MDLQGQPIPPGQRSTKVTSDPERYEQPINEPSGPVTNDSLAAESATKGGAYSQNRGAQPMGVSGKNSTVTNTDTSSARKIDPDHRDTQDKYPEALGGQGNFPGAHLPESGYTGGSTAAKQELGLNKGEYSAAGKQQQQPQQKNTDQIHPHQHQPRHPVGQQQKQTGAPASGSGYQGGVAPSYVQDVLHNLGNTKPKGTNLKEGDIPDDAPNASYTTDIGSENDPGRLAQGGFQLRSAESGPAGTSAGRQKGVDNEQPFQALQSDQRA
ncbi:hypothetical protein ASPACDRAFT_109553 [Aspergillus aculeatus ATCC 16872]|uniref:Uncharacterized protein n=1 Tax=Aspergillus aculeatus (strain ATCC 16872 / CBS 172.66 / WB 5094) TaxID=690307 RepID=A0A1L9X8G8_ASPA1|nr:uncharacterized protein ASPACDRAFT_109553 [Aspergillus aculeatus ATCC 16872]OJK04736.1 hypothetical protein ASPACDRAFT_109553 [Aspergillus aculeatus ATCC 16872]